MVMDVVHVDFRPALSNAVQVTVVDPTGKAYPLGGEQVLLRIPDPSVAVVVKLATTVVCPLGLMF